jgi:gliding motility-associated-like protein
VESYRWDFGDGDSAKGENPLYCYTKSGAYNVTLTVVSDSGCSSTLTKENMVTVYSRPMAAFTYSPQPVTILTPTVQFMDESIDAYGLGYRWWSFGDGSDSVSNSANPTHTYRDTGAYCATLIEMNNKGCMDTVTNCLIIEPQYNLYIPSAFTPNGDGLNETFKPVGQYVKSFEMYIFDRWGIQLYHTTDINQGWNGTVNGGSISQEDTYIYKITVRDAQGIPHSYIGNVTLVK